MKTAEQARREVYELTKGRESRRHALIEKAKDIGSGNELFLVLSIIYSAIDLEIELGRSKVDLFGIIDISKINPEIVKLVADALIKNGYNVIHRPNAPSDLRLCISW